MNKMRKKTLAAFAFVMIAAPMFAQENKEAQVIDKVVAVVGKNIILQSDIENQYLQYRLQGGAKGSAKSLRCDILEDMLFQKLMLNQAEMDSIVVTDEQVEKEMDRRISYFISQIGSQEKLEVYFNKTMPEIKEELRRAVKDQILQEQVQNSIMQGVEIAPAEVRSFFKDIPADSIPLVSPEYEIVQIVKRPPVSVDEKLRVKDKLYQIRKRILAGESFSTLAVLYSEDPGSAKKGGELGFVSRGEFAPEFEAAAFNLKEGEISEVIETEFGFHIIQLIEKKDGYVNTRHILLTAKVPIEALEKAQTELDSVAKLIRDGEMTFEQACLKFSDDDTKNNGGYIVNASTGGNRISIQDLQELESYYNEFKNLSFVISKLEVDQLSDPVPMVTDDNKDAFRLVMVKKKIDAHKANLKDDYSRIQTWALQNKKQQTIDKWINDKSTKAYVRIDENFADCEFKFDWKTK
jgi:Parvulin-like peptidyl-prolyl isomerase